MGRQALVAMEDNSQDATRAILVMGKREAPSSKLVVLMPVDAK